MVSDVAYTASGASGRANRRRRGDRARGSVRVLVGDEHADLIGNATLAHELLVQVDPLATIVRAGVRHADDRAMAELPEVFECEVGAGHAVGVDARDLAAGRPVRDADHVAVLLRQLVERVVAALDVADDDDPVRVRALEHRAVRERDVRAVVDVAEEQPVVAHPGCVVDATQDLDVERVGDVAGDDPQQ